MCWIGPGTIIIFTDTTVELTTLVVPSKSIMGDSIAISVRGLISAMEDLRTAIGQHDSSKTKSIPQKALSIAS
jgi:hypothetical protein